MWRSLRVSYGNLALMESVSLLSVLTKHLWRSTLTRFETALMQVVGPGAKIFVNLRVRQLQQIYWRVLGASSSAVKRVAETTGLYSSADLSFG